MIAAAAATVAAAAATPVNAVGAGINAAGVPAVSAYVSVLPGPCFEVNPVCEQGAAIISLVSKAAAT